MFGAVQQTSLSKSYALRGHQLVFTGTLLTFLFPSFLELLIEGEEMINQYAGWNEWNLIWNTKVWGRGTHERAGRAQTRRDTRTRHN